MIKLQAKSVFWCIALIAFSYNKSSGQIVRGIDSASTPYTPFMLHNAKWTFQSGGGGGGGTMETWNYYWTTFDTTISNLFYTALYYKQDAIITPDQGTTSYTHGVPTLIGYLRQDTLAEKVFFLALDSTRDTVIYDFTIPVGDTIYPVNTYYSDTSIFLSKDSFESGGIYYPRLNILTSVDFEGHYWWQNAWIEGFGSTTDLFYLLYVQGIPNYGTPIGISQLYCFSANGVTIYPNYANDTCAYIPVSIKDITESKPSIYPNPASDICTLQWNGASNILSASLFDATGRLVQPLFSNQTLSSFNFNTQSLASGIYFVKIYDSEGRTTVLKLAKQ